MGFMASGEKSKARDIVAAIRTLKAIEAEGRRQRRKENTSSPGSRVLVRSPFSIFPDPVTGKVQGPRLADDWRGTESLLTPIEYDSAKRTPRFNAFYTSPTVITTIHEAIARLGVPANATILGAGMRHRQLHEPRPREHGSSRGEWTPSRDGSRSAVHPTRTSHEASRTPSYLKTD